MLALVPCACGWYANVQPWRMPPRWHDAAVMTANFRPGSTWRSASDSVNEDDEMQSADSPSSVNVSDAVSGVVEPVSGASARLIQQSDLGDAMSEEEQRVLVMKTVRCRTHPNTERARKHRACSQRLSATPHARRRPGAPRNGGERRPPAPWS